MDRLVEDWTTQGHLHVRFMLTLPFSLTFVIHHGSHHAASLAALASLAFVRHARHHGHHRHHRHALAFVRRAVVVIVVIVIFFIVVVVGVAFALGRTGNAKQPKQEGNRSHHHG